MSDMDKYINNLVCEFKRLSYEDVEDCSDSEKLLYLYAYYHYFNADSSKITDIIQGSIYQPDASDRIAGIYLDQDSDNGDVDAIIAVYSDDNSFDFPAILKMFKDAESAVCSAQEQKSSVRKELGSIVREDEYRISPTRPLKIRLITNYNPKTVGNKRAITNAIQTMKPEHDYVTYHISFGLDIEYEIMEIENPKEYVDEAVIKLDAPNNYMRFGAEESLIVNISAFSLKNLYEQYGYRGLFAQNLRYYVKNAKIDGNIVESIQEHPENFWYYNNGVILICDDYRIEENCILVRNFSIINGGQTTKLVGETEFAQDFYVFKQIEFEYRHGIPAADLDLLRSILYEASDEDILRNEALLEKYVNVVYVDAASESNIPENVSEEIKEALVSYRTKTYKLNRIKAYEVFKNVSCDRIAKFAPTSLEELKALRCLDEAQITLYGQDIIEIVKQVLNK